MLNHTTIASFEEDVVKSDVPVLVDFWANWCGPCKMLTPILEEIDGENNGSFKIMKVDIDQEPDLAQKFGVMSIPTLIVFKNGEVANKSVGLIPKDKVLNLINA